MNKLPAGTYYVGDLCYILADDDYDEIVCSFEYGDGDVYTVNGFTFAWSHTSYGDGVYQDKKKNLYPVDAGLIGILRLDDHPEMLADLLQQNEAGLNHYKHNIFTFNSEFDIEFYNGKFNVAGNVIDTNQDEEHVND